MLNPGHPLLFLAALWFFWFCLWWCEALSRCGVREGPDHLGLPSSWDQLLLRSLYFLPLVKSLLLSWPGHALLRWILSAAGPPQGIHNPESSSIAVWVGTSIWGWENGNGNLRGITASLLKGHLSRVDVPVPLQLDSCREGYSFPKMTLKTKFWWWWTWCSWNLKPWTSIWQG